MLTKNFYESSTQIQTVLFDGLILKQNFEVSTTHVLWFYYYIIFLCLVKALQAEGAW